MFKYNNTLNSKKNMSHRHRPGHRQWGGRHMHSKAGPTISLHLPILTQPDSYFPYLCLLPPSLSLLPCYFPSLCLLPLSLPTCPHLMRTFLSSILFHHSNQFPPPLYEFILTSELTSMLTKTNSTDN